MTSMMKIRLTKGFSLIELMVVVGIIAILVALGSVSFTTAQKKARDARRKTDVKAMQNAFEQYYSVNGGYAACGTMAAQGGDYLPGGLPSDPKPGWSAYNCSYDAGTGEYCACALLENEQGNASAGDCSDYTIGDYFCVQNQQ